MFPTRTRFAAAPPPSRSGALSVFASLSAFSERHFRSEPRNFRWRALQESNVLLFGRIPHRKARHNGTSGPAPPSCLLPKELHYGFSGCIRNETTTKKYNVKSCTALPVALGPSRPLRLERFVRHFRLPSVPQGPCDWKDSYGTSGCSRPLKSPESGKTRTALPVALRSMIRRNYLKRFRRRPEKGKTASD